VIAVTAKIVTPCAVSRDWYLVGSRLATISWLQTGSQ